MSDESPYLKEMAQDAYFPPALVRKGQQILERLDKALGENPPDDVEALLELTHAATEEFNELAEEFLEQDSEIETAARDDIGTSFGLVLDRHGFGDVDIEDVIAPRDW